MGQYAATECPFALSSRLQRRRRPADLLQHPVDDEVFDGGGAGTHLVDGHGIVGRRIDQRPQGGGVVGNGHLVAHVSGLVQIDDRLEIAVDETPERIALEPTVAREPIELQILDDGGHGALRQHRHSAGARARDLSIQGLGDDLQIR